MTIFPDEWLEQFVLPLVAGGELRVGGPIDAADLESLLEPRPKTEPLLERIARARRLVAAELVLDPPWPELDEPALRMAASLQNLLFLAHPAAHQPLRSRHRLKEVARFALQLAALGPPRRADELIDRHTLLHQLFDLGRDDMRVTFWAGRREFRGKRPPPRLLLWPTVRRVREERWRVELVTEAVNDLELRIIVRQLLFASPLTDLLHPERPEPRLEIGGLGRWLRLPEVARAVADHYLTVGLEAIGPPLALALISACGQKGQAKDVRIFTEFTCHLQLLALLGEPPEPPVGREQSAAAPSRRRPAGSPARPAGAAPEAMSTAGEALAEAGVLDRPPVRLWAARPPVVDERARLMRMQELAQGRDALRDFFGLFAAAERLGMSRPPDIAGDPRLKALFDGYARACQLVCGEPRVQELFSLLSHGVGRLELAS